MILAAIKFDLLHETEFLRMNTQLVLSFSYLINVITDFSDADFGRVVHTRLHLGLSAIYRFDRRVFEP
jgi:hypothetical protein